MLKRYTGFLCLATWANLLTSCFVVTGLDPAEQLAHRIEDEAHLLRNSGAATRAFDYTPDEVRIKTAPHYHGAVTLGVHLDRKDADHSAIVVNGWFTTTYHNRLVWVNDSMEKTKKPGDSFRIVLRSSDGRIQWTALE